MSQFAKVAALLLCLFAGPWGFSQTTNISGIINNTASQVNSVSAVTNSVNVASTAGFTVGDTVLLIQMKGATINTSNSASFGDITDLGSAGNYEINVVCQIDGIGNEITLQNVFSRTYDSGTNTGVQLIKVETYVNAIITGPLVAPDWDGTTGGVLVFQTTGWLRMRPGNSVDIDNVGFEGGAHQVIGDGCGCGFSDPTHSDYYYPTNSALGAPKGEGIAPYTAGRESGKGKQANGGGGGVDHNAGGAGGGNYGIGGEGGQPCTTRSCFLGQYCRGFHPGVGGLSLSTEINNNKIFLGGGGGAGDDNGGAGSGGGDGGGIAIIMADSIFGNSGTIFARGSFAGTGAGDGAGGGGAGGTVLVQARTFHPTSPFGVQAFGGNGGLSSWSVNSYNSKGKGGGGGGGVFMYSGATVPGNFTIDVSGGDAGYEVSAAAGCGGNTGGATPGGIGASMTNLSIPQSTTGFGTCVLPVEYAYITAEKVGTMAKINWQTFQEINSTHFDVERSLDGKNFQALGIVPSQGDQGGTYVYTDTEPRNGVNFYRLRQYDSDGSNRISKVVAVSFGEEDIVLTKLYPNPVQVSDFIKLELGIPKGQSARVIVMDALGRPVFQDQIPAGETLRNYSIPTDKWSGGVYFLKVSTDLNQQLVRRITVMD